jgi:hypothetical protein
MSAPWHRNVPSCHCQLPQSDAELLCWLRDLSRYIVGQLAYLSEKLDLSGEGGKDFA